MGFGFGGLFMVFFAFLWVGFGFCLLVMFLGGLFGFFLMGNGTGDIKMGYLLPFFYFLFGHLRQ